MTRDDLAWLEASKRFPFFAWWWRIAVQPGGPGKGIDRGALWVYAFVLRMHRLVWVHGVIARR